VNLFLKRIILFSLLLAAFIFDLNSGSISFTFNDIKQAIFEGTDVNSTFTIIFELRFPRVFTAVLSGIALSVSGLLLQTLFNNPLAGPYIFGISSGASFGVATLLLGMSFFGMSAMPGTFSLAFAGIIGAAFVLLIVVLISLKIKDSLTILIIGVFLGSGISAVVNLMQYFSNAYMLKKFVVWTMGSLDAVNPEQLYFLSAIIFVFFALSVFSSKYFDSLYIGEENARTVGVNVNILRFIVFLTTGVMTGVITAFCGPIGFIGIAVPHIARYIFKTSRHLELIIYSAVIGSIMMLVSDGISHSIENQLIPINTITAFIGVPVIFWVILRNRRS